jgi:hypothetical protein
LGEGGVVILVASLTCVVAHTLLFVYLQIPKANDDANVQTFVEGDNVQVMGYGVEEDEKVAAHGKVKNLEGGSLHKVTIKER